MKYISIIILLTLLSCVADERARSKADGAAGMFAMLLPGLRSQPTSVSTDDKSICDPIRADDVNAGAYLQEGIQILSDQYNKPDDEESIYIIKPVAPTATVKIVKINLPKDVFVQIDFCMRSGTDTYISSPMSIECNNRSAPYLYFFLGESTGIYNNECRILYKTNIEILSAVYARIVPPDRSLFAAADYEHSIVWNQ
jgi:hypothetical protein